MARCSMVPLLFLLGAAAASEPFSFFDFFQGNWTIYRGITSIQGSGSGSVFIDEMTKMAIWKDGNSSSKLIGVASETDLLTGARQRLGHLDITFSDSSRSRGRFRGSPMLVKTNAKIVEDDDEADYGEDGENGENEDQQGQNLVDWFSFDFVSQGHGQALAHTACTGPAEGFCQFAIHGDSRFTITVYPEGSKESIIFQGERVHTPPGFFARYLPIAGLIALMLGNIYVQRRTRVQRQREKAQMSMEMKKAKIKAALLGSEAELASSFGGPKKTN